jgi:hypothetical protein
MGRESGGRFTAEFCGGEEGDMSSDWISMEKDLWSHPKTVRIMSACDADKCPVIGALFRLWSIADTHTEDGFLFGYTPEILDSEVSITGFSRAVSAVGWLIISENGLQVPDFQEHMSKSAKRRMKDTKRKKDVRKTSANTGTKCGPQNSTEHISIPDGIDKGAWAAYEAYRAKMPKQKRLTDEARKIAWEFLTKHPGEQKQIIETSIMNGWAGLFPPKAGNNGKSNGQHLTTVQRIDAAFDKLDGPQTLEGGRADLR